VRRAIGHTLIVSLLVASHALADEPCHLKVPHVVVFPDQKKLWLCDGASPVKSFDVSLGFHGSGKKARGDKKTPVGIYALEQPRSSKKYGRFIPIGYPTPDQRRAGYTGDSVGVHGPRRWLRWLGRANNWINTTAGCVAVASDKEIDEIVRWVKTKNARTIDIRNKDGK
jgi:murein L,D-transpeptidase YafK